MKIFHKIADLFRDPLRFAQRIISGHDPHDTAFTRGIRHGATDPAFRIGEIPQDILPAIGALFGASETEYTRWLPVMADALRARPHTRGYNASNATALWLSLLTGETLDAHETFWRTVPRTTRYAVATDAARTVLIYRYEFVRRTATLQLEQLLKQFYEERRSQQRVGRFIDLMGIELSDKAFWRACGYEKADTAVLAAVEQSAHFIRGAILKIAAQRGCTPEQVLLEHGADDEFHYEDGFILGLLTQLVETPFSPVRTIRERAENAARRAVSRRTVAQKRGRHHTHRKPRTTRLPYEQAVKVSLMQLTLAQEPTGELTDLFRAKVVQPARLGDLFGRHRTELTRALNNAYWR